LKTHHQWTKPHLDPTHVLPDVRPDDRPSLSVGRSIRLRDADRELPKHATEKLEIGELDRVDPNVVAQLDDDELWPGRVARREHVPVPLRRQDVRRRLGFAVRRMYPRGAVQRRIVEPVRQWHAEVGRGGRHRALCALRRRRRLCHVWSVVDSSEGG